MSSPSDRRRRRPLSQMLRALLSAHTAPRMNVAALRDALDDRAYGVLLFVFSLPNLLPLPPGMSAVFSVLVIFVAAQFVLGRAHPYLPAWLGRRSFARADFERALRRIRPAMRWTERLMRPRLLWLTSRPGERLIGALCILLALVAALPIPFAHELPGLAICVIALAVLERDGLVVLAGAGIGLAGLALYWAVVVRLSAPFLGAVLRSFGS